MIFNDQAPLRRGESVNSQLTNESSLLRTSTMGLSILDNDSVNLGSFQKRILEKSFIDIVDFIFENDVLSLNVIRKAFPNVFTVFQGHQTKPEMNQGEISDFIPKVNIIVLKLLRFLTDLGIHVFIMLDDFQVALIVYMYHKISKPF